MTCALSCVGTSATLSVVLVICGMVDETGYPWLLAKIPYYCILHVSIFKIYKNYIENKYNLYSNKY
jgi:hypothetical protein